jgi:tRNA modification GTPase
LILVQSADPIVAIATAPGKGGVGVLRFSFPARSEAEFLQFCQAFCFSTPYLLKPRHATLVRIKDGELHLIDEGIALVFQAPHSFTGEHVLEFQGHGGSGVLQAVLGRALEVARQLDIPLRHAQAGEFTQRAFLNGKLDLAQAEAVADLIDASSTSAVKAAAASLSGVFSERVTRLADQITHLRLLLEATLDFPEEEIDFLEKADAKGQLKSIQNTFSDLLQAAHEGVKFRDGLQVVLVGQPNVGKSSLLNALAGEDIAIVTPVAGTTRDRIKQDLNIRGIPMVLVDTAGLRKTQDAVEQIGIERTQKSIQEADLVIHLIDSSLPACPEDESIRKSMPAGLPILTVLNKADLAQVFSDASGAVLGVDTFVSVSAKTGLGLEKLKDEILRIAHITHTPDHGFMARQRHVDALKRCGQHLEMASEYAQQDDRILDLFAEELRLAHDSLGEITGRMLPDDLLGLIFSRFCIGK